MTLYHVRSNGNLLAPEFSLDTKFSKKTARCRILFRLFVFYSTFRVWRSVPWNISSNKECRRKKINKKKTYFKVEKFFLSFDSVKENSYLLCPKKKNIGDF